MTEYVLHVHLVTGLYVPQHYMPQFSLTKFGIHKCSIYLVRTVTITKCFITRSPKVYQETLKPNN